MCGQFIALYLLDTFRLVFYTSKISVEWHGDLHELAFNEEDLSSYFASRSSAPRLISRVHFFSFAPARGNTSQYSVLNMWPQRLWVLHTRLFVSPYRPRNVFPAPTCVGSALLFFVMAVLFRSLWKPQLTSMADHWHHYSVWARFCRSASINK